MIVIPPRDPNENTGPDPAEEALGKAYEQFTNVQNLAEFHAALRRRDALYDAQHQEMSAKPEDYENLHPQDFFNQFHRRADEDDKSVVSQAPYRIRQQLRDALAPERDTAQHRALETYKKLFVDRQVAQLDEDRLYYLGKMADAANDQDRERYTTALIGRLKLSGDVGLLYKDDAERLIENIPSDVDIFSFNRQYASDPTHAQRMLLNGAYPNMRPELRDGLVKEAKERITYASEESQSLRLVSANSNLQSDTLEGNSGSNIDADSSSNGQGEADDDTAAAISNELAANAPSSTTSQTATECPSLIGPVPVPGYTEKGSFSWRACNDQIFIDAANNYNRTYGLQSDDPGYITPQLLKAWAIIENGDNKEKFLRDPFTANSPGDWDDAKTRITGLQQGEAMNPEKSAGAALEWMRYKSFRPGGNGTLAGGLRNYSGGMDMHDAPSRKPYFDYHPGAVHREWYPAAILGLEAKMLGMVRPQME